MSRNFRTPPEESSCRPREKEGKEDTYTAHHYRNKPSLLLLLHLPSFLPLWKTHKAISLPLEPKLEIWQLWCGMYDCTNEASSLRINSLAPTTITTASKTWFPSPILSCSLAAWPARGRSQNRGRGKNWWVAHAYVWP